MYKKNFLEIFLLIQCQKNHMYLIVKVIFSCGEFAITIDCGKGGLTSETFSLSLKSPQKGAKNYPIFEDLCSFLS